MKLLNYTLENIPEWASSDPLLVGLRGSDAHGTKLSEDDPNAVDDVDVFVVTRQPVDHYLSLHGHTQEHFDTAGNDIDILVYDVRKFVRLLVNGNPNCIAWLWNRQEDYFLVNPHIVPLIENRELFVTKQVLKALYGYAYGQQQRMLRRNAYQGYMGEKRKALVDKYGYDTKFAAHTIRLARLGGEAAKRGTLWSYRPDEERQLIKDVKAGRHSFEDITTIIAEELENFSLAEKNTDLPKCVDSKVVNDLLLDILR